MMKIKPRVPRPLPALLLTCASTLMLSSACADSNVAGDGAGYQVAMTAISPADSYFNQAEQAARQGGDVSGYQALMAGGSLAMYPEYWQLSQYLDRQSPQAIISFAQRYNGSAMAEKLTADYAEAQANAGNYPAVRAVAGYIRNADASEACAIGLGYQYGGDVLRGLVEKPNVWLNTDKKQPALCRQLATAMNTNPMISNDDRQERLYRMLRTGSNGDIVQLSSRLGVSMDYNALMAASSSPLAALFSLPKQPATQPNRYLYLYALSQLTKSSVNQAASQLANDIAADQQGFFDEKTRQYAYRTLGVARMNVNTDQGFSRDALTWMQQSLGVPFNFEEAEDYAQAAIRFSSWSDVVNAIGAMDYKTQQQPIWRYWLARAYANGDAGQRRQASLIFSQLAQTNDYYGLMAKDRIGQRFAALPSNPSVTANDYQRLAQDANFVRAFTLYQLNASPAYRNREWNWAVRQAKARGDAALIAAAAWQAHKLGWYDRAIFAIETSDGGNGSLGYPMPQQTTVVHYSQQAGIDPAWAYGIMRQESRFNTTARSSVGAGGLMQIMPDTAKYIAKKLGEPYSSSALSNAETNIRYGTFYLSDTLNRLFGQPVLATAGYNAGPSKARTWQSPNEPLAADQYVETIPYSETRGYVKAVMENTTNYAVLLGSGSTSISQRMGTIPSRAYSY